MSHNAGFDRPFIEKRLGLSGLAWICSLNDLDWREWGFEGRSLAQLLWQCGWFYEAHRASTDVNALLHLLDHRLSPDQAVMKALLEGARCPTWVIEAVGAPFSARVALKAQELPLGSGRRVLVEGSSRRIASGGARLGKPLCLRGASDAGPPGRDLDRALRSSRLTAFLVIFFSGDRSDDHSSPAARVPRRVRLTAARCERAFPGGSYQGQGAGMAASHWSPIRCNHNEPARPGSRTNCSFSVG